MDKNYGFKFKYIDVSIVFLLMLCLFNFFLHKITIDSNDHLLSIIKVNQGKADYLPNFLFYFIVNFLSGFSDKLPVLRDVAILVLALATAFKFTLSKRLLYAFSDKIRKEVKTNTISVLAFCMLFAFAIPDFYSFFKFRYMYLGRVPPVVWHNSTLSLLFPFSILLFIHHLKMDKKNSALFFTKDNLILILLAVVNIFIKPSFIFVYIPVAGLLILEKNGFKNIKTLLKRLLPLGVCLLVLFGQYVLIYFFQIGSFQKGESGVTLGKPFEFIRNYLPFWYVPIGLFISYLFPLLTYFFYKDILKFRPFYISFCYAIVGFVISTFVIEDGPRRFHGNFTWQNIICAFLLLITTVMYLLPKLYTKERFSSKVFILGIVFFLQFLSGILYIIKLYYTGYIS